MKKNQCPISVAIVATLYIGVGTIGFVAHLAGFQSRNIFRFDGVWIELTELVAILCGAFMLRSRNWARWLALAWMGFHVVLSGLDAFHGFVVHCLFFAVIAWALFRPDAVRYFRRAPVRPT
jgi:hypothetical protein